MDSPITSQLVKNLEQRIESCETIVGSKATPDAKTVTQSLLSIRSQLNSIFQGPLKIFEQKYESLRFLFNAPPDELPLHLLSLEAKQNYVLENEEFLKSFALELKQFDDLVSVVNPQSFADQETCEHRLRKLELKGQQLCEEALWISHSLQDLACQYNTSMNLFSAMLKELDDIMTEMESQRV